MFGFLRDRRRRKLLATPFPPHHEAILRRNVGHYPLLPLDDQAALRDLARVFVAEKAYEGCGGLFITDEIKFTIAGQACLPLLKIEHDYYSRVPSVVVYPSVFQTPNPEDGWEDDFLSETVAEGQAVMRGPVILAWDRVLEEGRDPAGIGHNVVLHEFTHELDFLDATTDGTPPLDSKEARDRWVEAMTAAFDRHKAKLNSKRRRPTFFSEQAGDSPAEFFADAVEAFYCRPHDLHAEEPAAFAVIADYFKVDPRGWFSP